MYNQQWQNPVRTTPTYQTPIYSGRLQIGILDHPTKRIRLFHSPFSYYVHNTHPGSIVFDHVGRRIGNLGFGGQLHRFDQQNQ